LGEALSLAILISGRGSNMAAIARQCARGAIAARIALVIADRPEAGGLALARSLGLATEVVPFGAAIEKARSEQALREAIDRSGAELIILAGFMRILSASLVAHYAGRMLNIHPSLLPRHKGLHTHRRALEAREREHGASVHFVTPELDGGPVVLQGRIAVREGETEAQLSGRVQAVEHIIYPRAIGWIAAGRLAWDRVAPRLDGRVLQQPVVEDFDAI
jgi:phosphoribosylglycinamide formyltransferase-1